MKKLQLLAIAILIGGTSVFAFENMDPDPIPAVPVLRAQIVELLPPAYFGDIEESIVKVEFTYSSEGEIIVLKVGTTNKYVKEYLRKHLNQKKVDQPGEIGHVYTFIMRMKAED